MNRRTFLGYMGAGALSMAGPLAGCVTSSSIAVRKPNIVFILIDDMGYADVGCFGSTFHETPHIDRLAAEGMRFTQGYAACPVCSPTRASIMSGKYPARLKLTNFLKGVRSPEDSPVLTAPYADQMNLEEVTVAEALQRQGYATALVGKWHLGGGQFKPENQGFDTVITINAGGGVRGHLWPDWKGNPAFAGRADGDYLADRLTEEACAFIDTHRDQPFFLYLAHYSVHIPLDAKEDKIAKYEAKLKTHPPKPGQQHNPHYAAMVESVDESVGKILNTLRQNGLDDNTLVVFFSDNGGLSVEEGPLTPATTNFPLRAGKGYLYEGGIREPLIVRWPGVTTPNSTCTTPVCSIDFFPTFCVAAGLESLPLNPAGPIDGLDISALLNGKSSLNRDAIFWHYPHFANQGGRPGGAVRSGSWKLIENYEDGSLELYNLDNDIGESRNLASSESQRVQALHEKLIEWRKSVDANMPPPNSKYRPNSP